MYSTNQLVVLSFLFASFGLALPTAPANPEGYVRSSAARSETHNLEINHVSPYLERRDDMLIARGDPYGGKYAPSEATREDEIENTKNDLSPDGRDGQQVAKDAGLDYDGDSGKKEYLEVANGGPLPANCGSGCENSIYSKASKASQINKAQKAGDKSDPYPKKGY